MEFVYTIFLLAPFLMLLAAFWGSLNQHEKALKDALDYESQLSGLNDALIAQAESQFNYQAGMGGMTAAQRVESHNRSLILPEGIDRTPRRPVPDGSTLDVDFNKLTPEEFELYRKRRRNMWPKVTPFSEWWAETADTFGIES